MVEDSAPLISMVAPNSNENGAKTENPQFKP